MTDTWLVLFLLIVIVIVSGCSTQPKEVIVVEYEFIKYDVPKTLTQRCIVEKPISIEEYVSLTDKEKRLYLTRYNNRLMGQIKKCDNQLRSLVSYIDKRNELYENTSKGGK